MAQADSLRAWQAISLPHSRRLTVRLIILVIWTAALGAAQSCDFKEYKPAAGLKAEMAQGALQGLLSEFLRNWRDSFYDKIVGRLARSCHIEHAKQNHRDGSQSPAVAFGTDSL